MCNELGRLKSVELREVWPNEAADFTPWLAEEENLALLADTLNMELELEGREVRLGFGGRIDILCRNLENDSQVLIENQLEETDSDHLGRILEYMTGVDAATVVWIAENFREEHRAVFNRLNEITEGTFRFFGVEIELWRIGNSSPAPMFNIVSSPNDWSREVRQTSQHNANRGLSETQLQQQQYWTELREHMIQSNCQINPPRPSPRSTMFFPIGRAGFVLKVTIRTSQNRMNILLNMSGPNATAHFNLLDEDQEEIAADIGGLREDEQLVWAELPEQESSWIALRRNNTDPTDEADWPNQHAWLAEKLELFDRVFRHRVQALNAEDWPSEDEDDDA